MSSRYARRALLRAAVFAGGSGHGDPHDAESWASPPVRDASVVTGLVADVSPHVLILQTAAGEERMTLTPGTKAWRGFAMSPAALTRGDPVIVRMAGRQIAERIWARIGRVTGTIVERRDLELLVDEGPAKGRQVVLIGKGSLRQVQVRFPRIEPGFLFDVIGLRQDGYLLGLTPATAQPPYRADRPPTPPLVSGHLPERISGTAVWHEPGAESPGLAGVAYPALDPETNCEHAPRQRRDSRAVDPHQAGPGCVQLPYLSVGSAVRIRNECADREAVLPVTSCGASARLFCDRCVKCGTSPRGRVADLTVAAFAGLGGNLEDGCFNATLAMTG